MTTHNLQLKTQRIKYMEQTTDQHL